MNRKNRILIVPVLLTMLGCASNQRKLPEISDTFVTNIKENGTKLFSYSMTNNSFQQDGGGRGRGYSGRGHGRGEHVGQGQGRMRRHGDGYGGANRNKEMIYQRLESKLAETGYCREGYMELDFFMSRGQSQIKGECNDGASDNDRKIFAVK